MGSVIVKDLDFALTTKSFIRNLPSQFCPACGLIVESRRGKQKLVSMLNHLLTVCTKYESKDLDSEGTFTEQSVIPGKHTLDIHF